MSVQYATTASLSYREAVLDACKRYNDTNTGRVASRSFLRCTADCYGSATLKFSVNFAILP